MTGRVVAWFAFVAALAGLSYSLRIAEGKPPEDALYQYESAVGAAIQYAIMLGIVLAIAAGLPWREVFALRAPGSWPRALALSLAGFFVILFGAGLLLTLLDANDEQGLTPDEWDPDRAGAYAANFVAVAVIAPVVEELCYRGLGFSLLLPLGPWVAAVVTAAAFAAAHGLVLAFPALMLFGLVNAWLRLKTGSIVPPILVHMAFNTVSLVAAVTL